MRINNFSQGNLGDSDLPQFIIKFGKQEEFIALEIMKLFYEKLEEISKVTCKRPRPDDKAYCENSR